MSDNWRPDGLGIVCGGEPGGDDQVGKAFSVRFRHTHRPGAMISQTAYAMSVAGDCERPFLVRVEIDWLVSDDPEDLGSTERWSDCYSYNAQSYRTVAEAERAARRLARQALSDDSWLTWDGLPPWERD
jgi:hypothetical protein